MDSTNSASLQSSSGGGDDQEFNSHGGADHNNNNNFQNNLFDPFSNYNFNPMNNNIISPQTSFFDTINPNMFLQSNKSSSQAGGGFFPSPATEHGGGGSSSATTTTTTTTITPAPAAAAPPRNPKKRSRASRRAPTTVLTTDTSNFRAMVQEFTGIPSPPFSPSYFPRTRFDHIFTNNIRSISSATTTTNNNINIPFNISSQPPNYLKRPFPLKIQPQQVTSTQFLSPSLLNSIANNNIVTATSSTNVFGTTVQQNSNSLSSFLQSHEKYQVGSKDQEPFDQLLNNSSQFSSQHEHGHFRNSTIAGLPNLISPESSRNVNQGSTSSFNGEKVQENTTNGSRGEGIVESWICSSD